MIKNKERKQLGIKSVIDAFIDDLSREAKNILYKISNQKSSINYKNLDFKRGNNFPTFSTFSKFQHFLIGNDKIKARK